MATNLAGIPAPINRESDPFAGTAHDIRRTVGRAWLAIAASGEKIRKALAVHHSQVSYRKAGSGAVANAAIEIASLERAGINSDPLIAALESAQLAARGPICLTDAIRSEADADTTEELRAAEFAIGTPGSREGWAEALVAQSRESLRLAQALLAGGGR